MLQSRTLNPKPYTLSLRLGVLGVRVRSCQPRPAFRALRVYSVRAAACEEAAEIVSTVHLSTSDIFRTLGFRVRCAHLSFLVLSVAYHFWVTSLSLGDSSLAGPGRVGEAFSPDPKPRGPKPEA